MENKKICKLCKRELDIDHFYKVPSMKDGHDNTCKDCRRELRRKRDGLVIHPAVTEGTMVCPVCKRELDVSEFRVFGKSKTGRYWMCDSCYEYHTAINNGKDKNYFRKLRLKLCPEYRQEIQKIKEKSRHNNFEAEIYRKCLYRAKQRGIEFNLELSDIVIPKICPILEVPLVFGNKENYEYSPSIDRIDNSKGYIKGNIQIISMKANTMKNSATPEELYKFCKNILRYSPNCSKETELENKESLG